MHTKCLRFIGNGMKLGLNTFVKTGTIDVMTYRSGGLKNMDFEQDGIDAIVESERQMMLHGLERYDKYFAQVSNTNDLLHQFVKGIDRDHQIFAMFLTQIRKHYILAWLSILRLHFIQTSLNLRFVLESESCAAYAIAYPDVAGFADIDESGIMNPSIKLSKKRNKWLDETFKEKSDSIKDLKRLINEFGAHSNIATAGINFIVDIESGKIGSDFFDTEDDYFVKVQLVQISDIALGLMELFAMVNADIDVIEFVDDFIPRLHSLGAENDRLRSILMEIEAHNTMQKVDID